MKIETLDARGRITPLSATSLRPAFDAAEDAAFQAEVAAIIANVRLKGEPALLDYCRRFDCPGMTAIRLRVSPEEFAEAENLLAPTFLDSLRFAAERIRIFHEREVEASWMLTREDGAIVGRMVRPVDVAGLYVPGGAGGSTPLVSSVLMNGIPARIAGVPRRIMCSPPDIQGKINPALLMAAREIGIDEVYKLGSAWAVASMAYGAGQVPAVDVLVGPGNRYVAEAKRQVMGRVRIDMLAGPSEVLIVADASACPAFVAADMLAQAEHDPRAVAVLVCTEPELLPAVEAELAVQLVSLPRAEIAGRALADFGRMVLVDNLDQALELANDFAPEHLELQLAEPWLWLPRVRHAGAVFLGSWTPEAAGDYVAGPNHVLPTAGTARLASALGVETFIKKSSVISYSRQALLADAAHIRRLAESESLHAHGQSVALRLLADGTDEQPKPA